MISVVENYQSSIVKIEVTAQNSYVAKSINELLKHKLHSKTFWSEITRQFDYETGELQYFEDTWVGLVKQFREDVLPAEELQIKQFITIRLFNSFFCFLKKT